MHIIFKKNRAQGLAALINNWDDAKSALVDAENAEGSALRENEKYMDSIAGRTAQLQNELQRLYNTVLDNDFLKALTSSGTGLLTVIQKIMQNFGALKTIMGAITGVSLVKNGFSKTP